MLSGKIKFGSSGEYVNSAIKRAKPKKKKIKPEISANRLVAKSMNK